MTHGYPMTVDVLSMGTDWRVQVDGTHHSQHRLKRRAVEEAKSQARGHDGPAKVRIQAADGRWQNIIEY